MKHDSIFLPITNAIRNFTRRVGVDIVGYNSNHSDDILLKTILHHFGIKTILDVGANTGQYATEVMRHGYKGALHSFEPILSVYEQLKKETVAFNNWSAHHLGVGSRQEEIMINVSENFVSSSMLKVEQASLSAEPTSRITRQEKVKLTTVDDFLSAHPEIEKEILLKLDVQGYELEALKGALRTLPGIRLVQAELSFTPLYERGPLFGEIVKFMEANHFEIFTIMPGFRDSVSGRMLQADGIFVRKSE